VEILAEQGSVNVFQPKEPGSTRGITRHPIADVEELINRAFERSRFGAQVVCVPTGRGCTGVVGALEELEQDSGVAAQGGARRGLLLL
jgi:hypothetical protein